MEVLEETKNMTVPKVKGKERSRTKSGRWRKKRSDVGKKRMRNENMVWRKARKKPVIIEFREVDGDKEEIHTREGILVAIKNRDFVIKGIEGELYPITKSTFFKTYDIDNLEEA